MKDALYILVLSKFGFYSFVGTDKLTDFVPASGDLMHRNIEYRSQCGVSEPLSMLKHHSLCYLSPSS